MDSSALLLLLLLLCGALVESNIFEGRARLSGGSGRCSGAVELMRGQDEWGRAVSSEFWHLFTVSALCLSQGCGAPVSVTHVEDLPKSEGWYIRPDCVHENEDLTRCLWNSPDSPQGINVVCSESVRVLSGPSLCSGYVQMKLDEFWTSVCDGALDHVASEVLCKELSCGPPSVLQGPLPEVDGAYSLLHGMLPVLGGPILDSTFQCEGPESALIDCPRTNSSCSSGAAYISCSEPVRLVGGASRCEGRVEVKHGRQWSRLYPFPTFYLDLPAAVCRELDCGALVSMTRIADLSEELVWKAPPTCVYNNKAAVRDCTWGEQIHSQFGVELVCSDSVRLLPGPTLCSGPVQMKLDKSWTSVCEGALDRVASELLCRELGCRSPSNHQEALSAVGGAPQGLTFHCEDHDTTLSDCSRSSSSCSSGNTEHLTCSEPLRLVGGVSRCDGLLELQHRGEWKPVFLGGVWSEDVGQIACRDLNCGFAAKVTQPDVGIDSMWQLPFDCLLQRDRGLRACVTDIVSSPLAVKVMCSELLHRPVVSVTDGVSEAELQDSRVALGSSFGVRCSVEPQFKMEGSFVLQTPSGESFTEQAVNHSAHFLFNRTSHAHFGTYNCVYHQPTPSFTFTANSSVNLQTQRPVPNQAAVWSQLTWALLLGLVAGHLI